MTRLAIVALGLMLSAVPALAQEKPPSTDCQFEKVDFYQLWGTPKTSELLARMKECELSQMQVHKLMTQSGAVLKSPSEEYLYKSRRIEYSVYMDNKKLEELEKIQICHWYHFFCHFERRIQTNNQFFIFSFENNSLRSAHQGLIGG